MPPCDNGLQQAKKILWGEKDSIKTTVQLNEAE